MPNSTLTEISPASRAAAAPSLPLWSAFGSRFQIGVDLKGGDIDTRLRLLHTAIAEAEGGWLTPELLRLKGELLLAQRMSGAAETAEDLFRQALDGARRQETLSWELRAATSLARLLRDQGRSAYGIACLQPIYDRVTEGFGTADLITAKQLLSELGHAGGC